MCKRTKMILTVSTAVFVLFIFRNSLYPGQESGAQSRAVVDFINGFLARCHISYAVPELFIRKTGHFAEYFAYGLLLTPTVRAYRPGKPHPLFPELFFLLFVPVLDEAIQLFTPGRGSSVADVLLDFAGGCAGMLLCLALLHHAADKRRKRIPRDSSLR